MSRQLAKRYMQQKTQINHTSVVVYYQWRRMKNAYRNKLMKEVGEKNLAWIEVIHNITVTKQKEGIKKKPAVLIQFQM